MKLKCRINGTDYDLVQGATFTDNFNETLDSATIVLDHVQKIDGIRQYDDVFIWNADEEFNGYGNIGDIFELKSSVTIGGTQIGTSWNIVQPSRGMIIEDKGAYFELSGPICQIWACFFYDYTPWTENECRFDYPSMEIVANFIRSDGQSQETLTERGFAIAARDGSKHGTAESEIVLTNGEYMFTCVYDPETQTFTVAKSQDGVFINWMEYAGGSYKINDIDKEFDIRIFAEDFSNEGISDFDIEVSYRGKTYTFSMTDIEKTDETTRVVVFNNGTLGDIAFTFVQNPNADPSELPTPGSKEWDSEGLRNSDPLPVDTSNIFAEVDGISISNLTGTQDGTKPKPSFYKHLLFDRFPEEQVGLETGLYRCTIDLFSETKKLEKIALPNISITQSLKQEEKRSCWFYMREYVEAFSPKYKKASNKNEHKWRYVNKYSLSESGVDHDGIVANLKEVFDNVICPEMSMTNPSLKDLLSQIMRVKDMIPVVRDDVIYGLDISHTVGDFDRTNVNFVGGTLNSDDFATDARREHTNALSQENSAHMVEYLGFRAPNSAFLTLDQLTLETRFPIYKINSIKMCYYKKAHLVPGNGSNLPAVYKYFLCKQDITPLILQNVVRNTLSTNWESFRDHDNPSADVHDFSDINYKDEDNPDENIDLDYAKQFKLCTIGYDIGSNKLTGWGERYQYLDFLWFKNECSYIENIVNLLDAINPYGLTNPLQLKGGEGYSGIDVTLGINGIVSLDGDESISGDNIAKKIKSIVFEVDYDAMYSGAIMHGKEDIDRDDIVTVDNCNAALTVLESDGLFEREKMDRIGNKVFRMTARYDGDNGGADPSNVQKVGTYDEETDSIIYSREYQIYDNAILVNYESTHEYVLKNYFTSVWAKYRTYSLMSYGESIRRAENVRKFLLLSKETVYYENEGGRDELLFKDIETAKQFLSFVTPSKLDEESGTVKHDERLNCGFFVFYVGESDVDTGIYLSDINAFASGTSLCFNIATYDNVSGGNYIDDLGANLVLSVSGEDALDYKTTQKWWNMVHSASDAFMRNAGFYVCHLDNEGYFQDGLVPNTTWVRVYGYRYLSLPRAYYEADFLENSTMKIGVSKKPICKDNKEIIDMTLQFDYLAENKNEVVFSPWISKLNDLIGHYDKYDRDGAMRTDYVGGFDITCFAYDDKNWVGNSERFSTVVIKIKASDYASLASNNPFSSARFSYSGGPSSMQIGETNIVLKDECSWRLTLNSVRGRTPRGGIDVRASFEGNCQCYVYETFFWAKYNEKSFLKKNSYPNLVIHFDEAGSGNENGVAYIYLKGSIPAQVVSYDLHDLDSRIPSSLTFSFVCGKIGSDDPRDLSSRNSLVKNASIAGEAVQAKTFRKNMFIVASASKVERKLEYSQYKYDADADPAVNTFPGDMFVDANASVEDVFSVVEGGSGVVSIFVNPLRYEDNQNIPFTVRSIQYYYRDNDTGEMRFVFGVNLPEISQGNVVYNPFNVYLSAISKRCMDVYDENHNVIGKVKNALLNQETEFSEQYYEPIGRVPSTYHKAKYLESDGRQIIQVGAAVLNDMTSIECELMALGESEGIECAFGRLGEDGLIMKRDGSDLSFSVSARGQSQNSNTVKIDIGRKYSAKLTSSTLSLDGVDVAWEHGILYRMATVNGIDVFGVSLNGSIFGNGFIGRIYGLKIYEEGILAHDLVPCVRLSDNEPGMYDTVTGQFHANAGTGEFKVRF